jgi:hypothetical protein
MPSSYASRRAFANILSDSQSIATIVYNPTTTVTVTALPTTTTITTATQAQTFTDTAPAPTVYALTGSSPFKIETIGSGINGNFIQSYDTNGWGSSRYSFGTTGNVFSTYAGGDRFDETPGLYDQTRNWRVIYDNYSEGGGPVGDTPFLFKFTVPFSVTEGAEQTRTCPITFRVSTGAINGADEAAANWNCGVQWRTDNDGACSTFQAYAVSQ